MPSTFDTYDLSKKMTYQAIIRNVCIEYDVINIVSDFNISAARKTELFLLGAVFTNDVLIMGKLCNIMIMNKVMYILSIGDDYGCFS